VSKKSQRKSRQANRKAMSQHRKNFPDDAPSAVPGQLIAQVIQETTHYQGPVPPPSLLREYDAVVPGSAERLLAMAESQSAHRQDLERTVIHGDSRRAWAGLWVGALMGAGIIFAGTYVAIARSPSAGASIVIGTVVSLVGVFVTGSLQRSRERQKKSALSHGRRS